MNPLFLWPPPLHRHPPCSPLLLAFSFLPLTPQHLLSFHLTLPPIPPPLHSISPHPPYPTSHSTSSHLIRSPQPHLRYPYLTFLTHIHLHPSHPSDENPPSSGNHETHTSLQSETEPHTYLQAAMLPHWLQAISKEFLSLQQQGTWSLIPPPLDTNIIGCCWMFRIKHPADGTPPSYKARLVAQGFTQEFGTDFQDTFSPVARLVTIRLFLTMAIANRWPILQCDVSNAFLHGHLDRPLYMHQPPGFQDVDLPSHVCLLRKTIYGLRQAPRLWYTTFSNTLHNHGFQVSTTDPSLLIYKIAHITTYIVLYVDDILVAGNNPTFITTLFATLNHQFHMKPLSHLSSFLGLNICTTPIGLFLNQPHYIQELLQIAGLTNHKPVQTPTSLKPSVTCSSTEPFSQPTHYRRLTGSL